MKRQREILSLLTPRQTALAVALLRGGYEISFTFSRRNGKSQIARAVLELAGTEGGAMGRCTPTIAWRNET